MKQSARRQIPLEGGIVKQILVKEGQTVKAGQVLVVLDDTRFKSEYQETLPNA